MATLKTYRFADGLVPERTRPSDFILTRRKQIYSKLISFGQHLRFHGPDKPYAHWTHVALVAGENGELIEALSGGVQRTTLETYRDVEFHYVQTLMDDHDREQAVNFANLCVGYRYDWFTILGLVPTILLGGKIGIQQDGSLICSGLVARSLERGWSVFERAPNRVMPADLAKHFNVNPNTAIDISNPSDRLVGLANRRGVEQPGSSQGP